MVDHTYNANFQYTHDNPYHDRLQDYSEFVLRDDESEQYRGKWNQQVFKREARLFLEIGTGYGHFMIDFCQAHPHINFVGMDYRFKRSYGLAKQLMTHYKGQFVYLRAKGERIQYQFAESELDKIFYFFPDPWPKTRHHKKRLFQAPFLSSAYKVLKPGGEILIKTDHSEYAQWMEKVIAQSPLFELKLVSFDLREQYPDHFLSSFSTKFEKIFLSQGIKIKAFVLRSRKGCELQ